MLGLQGSETAMLFILTGDVQIGKTRWLEKLCEELASRGVAVSGVIAPGQWVARAPGQAPGSHGLDGAGGFEKLGIDNVLLPQGRRIEFARRRDLASVGDGFADGGQARAAGLGWAISDEAIDAVNDHFVRLGRQASHQADESVPGRADAGARGAVGAGGLLVVDELGRLELLRGCGLVRAMELLDRGPTRAFPHALIVVRETLLDAALARLEPVWSDVAAIGPDDRGRLRVLAAFGMS